MNTWTRGLFLDQKDGQFEEDALAKLTESAAPSELVEQKQIVPDKPVEKFE